MFLIFNVNAKKRKRTQRHKKTQSYSLSNSVFLYKNQRFPAKVLCKHFIELFG